MNEAAIKLLQYGRPPLSQYTALRDLRQQNEHAFFSLLLSHPDEVLPIVYTPTVGAPRCRPGRARQPSRSATPCVHSPPCAARARKPAAAT